MAHDNIAADAIDATFLHEIVEHVAHPIFVKDRQLRFVFLNRSFCELVGYTRAQLLGKTDHDFFPREEADFFRAKDEEVFATQSQVVIDEEPFTDGTGRRHMLATTKVPLRGAAGEATHLVGIIHDITQLKGAQASLLAAKRELELRVQERSAALAAVQESLLRKERFAILGQLAGGLAHQIRNPLGTIKNAAYIIERHLGRRDDDEASRALGIIHDEVESANRIITNLLDYARVRPAIVRPTALSLILEQLLSCDEVPDDVTVERETGDLPLVAVDGEQVQAALEKITRNAIEAMPHGGTLTLRAVARDRAVVISIQDTGGGVPNDLVARLFEPLVTTKPMGLGLGLVTARSLVELQGGSIEYVPQDNGGAGFVVRLPIADPA